MSEDALKQIIAGIEIAEATILAAHAELEAKDARIAELEAMLAEGVKRGNALLDTSKLKITEIEAQIDEATNTERAAVVAWLCNEAERTKNLDRDVSDAIIGAALLIERGNHV